MNPTPCLRLLAMRALWPPTHGRTTLAAHPVVAPLRSRRMASSHQAWTRRDLGTDGFKVDGFSMVELAVVIMTLSLLVSVAIWGLQNTWQTGVQDSLQAMRATLQTILTAAANRLDISPCAMTGAQLNNVIVVANPPPDIRVTSLGGTQFRIQHVPTGQQITFQYQPCP